MKKLIFVLSLMVSSVADAGMFSGAAIVEYHKVIGHVDRSELTATRKQCEKIAADFSYKSTIKAMCNTFTHEDLAMLATNYYASNCDNVINEKDAEIDDDSITNPLIATGSRIGNAEFCKLALEANGQKADNKTIQEHQPEQTTIAEQPTQQPKSSTETSQSEPVIEKGRTWTGDWGNGIIATMTTEPCDIPDFTKLDYKYAMSVTIPIARLKKPADAWHIDGDRATTLMGCWFRTSGLSIHAKMIRKSNGKVTEQDFRLDDGNWSVK